MHHTAVHPIRYDIRCPRDDEFARAGYAARSAEAGRCSQTRYCCANPLDHAECRGRVFRCNALADIFEPAKIARSIL